MVVSFREQRETSKEVEVRCDACKGTGLQAVKQPAEPGRRIFPARCAKCDGKGRIKA
jgi:DnaJ-class molecular chaperone